MELNMHVVNSHRQLFNNSCIPMALEFVLKLIDQVDVDYLALQKLWNDRSNGTFADISGERIERVKFTHQFSIHKYPRGASFPLKALFDVIEKELKS